MEKELRKRLEEAAEKYADKHGFRVPYDGSNNFYDQTDVKASKDGFLAGGEWIFKEVGGETVLKEMRQMILGQCKEWMKENYHLFDHFDKDEVIADFEADMNKLWEGEK